MEITPYWIKAQIQISNEQAAINHNLYPIQEQATQLELWEYVPCTCDESCTCRKLGCTHHWKLKNNIRFKDFVNGFLRTFVHANFHQSVLDALVGKEDVIVNSRAKNAVPVLKNLKENWESVAARAAGHNKTLFCDDWADDNLKRLWRFPISNSVYEAKQYCILYPDICVPYDDDSRKKLKKFYSIGDIDYLTHLSLMRDSFLRCMTEHQVTLPMLRKFDDPQKAVPFDPTKISLPKAGFKYGTSYEPEERQISFVLDKCFYKPTKSHLETLPKNDIPQPATFNSINVYQIFPLSGNGKTITVKRERNFRKITWGDLKFHISDDMVNQILQKFFVDQNEWYLLSPSMTDPDKNGLGYYIWKIFPSFTPRHASAIAAIMVKENLLINRGRKPIYLKKTVF